MDEVEVIHAARDLLLVLFAGALVWFLAKPIRKALEKPGSEVSAFGVTVKVGQHEIEIPVQEVSDQLSQHVGDLQAKVSSLLSWQADMSLAENGTQVTPTATVKKPAEHLDVRPKRLLWVDDVPTNNAYLAKQLNRGGVEIVQCLSTAEGIRAFHDQGPFGAVITDMGRTEGGQYDPAAGVKLARQLRETDPSIPIVVYATHRGIQGQAQGIAEVDALATDSPVELLTALHIEG